MEKAKLDCNISVSWAKAGKKGKPNQQTETIPVPFL
jgi:hypothetical protein